MGVLELIAVVLVIFWIGGLLLHIAGGLIHILLVLAIIIFAFRFFTGKSSKNEPPRSNL